MQLSAETDVYMPVAVGAHEVMRLLLPRLEILPRPYIFVSPRHVQLLIHYHLVRVHTSERWDAISAANIEEVLCDVLREGFVHSGYLNN
jgi:hypothetical protein